MTGRYPSNTGPEPLLRMRQLGAFAGNRALVDGVSGTVGAGELVILLGPNGAGKSTLLRLLARERSPDCGVAELLGRPLAHWPARELAAVRAVMPQHCPLTFPFTAAEVVALGLPGRHGGDVRHPVVGDLMRWLRVDGLADRAYPSLSGGEQQRVQLARVLAQVWQTPGPRLLLLDECTSALDPAQQYRVMAMLQQLACREGFAVIAACHDLALAARYASRVMLMADGRLVADGPPGDVLTGSRLAEVYGLDAQVGADKGLRVFIRGCLEPEPPVPDSLVRVETQLEQSVELAPGVGRGDPLRSGG